MALPAATSPNSSEIGSSAAGTVPASISLHCGTVEDLISWVDHFCLCLKPVSIDLNPFNPNVQATAFANLSTMDEFFRSFTCYCLYMT